MSGMQSLREHDIMSITSGSLLARNTVYNFIGQGVPMLVALFSIPLLINRLGTDRFGVLTLAWMVIGYFSLFDLGLGRALTKLVSEKLGASQEQEIPALVSTALFIMLLLGLVGTMVISMLSPWLVRDVLKIPEALQSETLYAFYMLAISIPVVISTTGLRGVLEAQQRFGLISAVRFSMGVFTFLGPLLVLPFSQSLSSVVAVLMAGRLLAWLVHLLLCLKVMPALRHSITLQRAAIGPLFLFGSWMTVSNIVGPLMTYLDRFLVGSIISMTAVAYYATPFDMVTNIGVIPSAIVGVLFPAFAASFVSDRNRTMLLFSCGLKYTFLILFPIILFIVTLAYEGLEFWLGPSFAQNSTHILQWLAIGIFINSMAQIPFALIQGAGRPDLTAKLHIIELPFYLLVVWWLIGAYGIEGAAISWVSRVAVDALFLFIITKRCLQSNLKIIWRLVFTIGVALLTLVLAILLTKLVLRGIFLALTLMAFVLTAWFLILTQEERALVQHYLMIVRNERCKV